MNISYAHGPGTTPLLADTIGGALNTAAARWADRDALISCHQQKRYSYAQLRHEADRVARALMAIGVQAGDRVGIWSPNRAEWMVTQYAAAKAGAILVNVNPAYRLRELEYALTQSGIRVLIAARRFRTADYVGMLTELAGPPGPPARRQPGDRLPALEAIVLLDESDGPGLTWQMLRAMADDVPEGLLREREASLQFDDPVNIQYTSGTTGHPKGA